MIIGLIIIFCINGEKIQLVWQFRAAKFGSAFTRRQVKESGFEGQLLAKVVGGIRFVDCVMEKAA